MGEPLKIRHATPDELDLVRSMFEFPEAERAPKPALLSGGTAWLGDAGDWIYIATTASEVSRLQTNGVRGFKKVSGLELADCSIDLFASADENALAFDIVPFNETNEIPDDFKLPTAELACRWRERYVKGGAPPE